MEFNQNNNQLELTRYITPPLNEDINLSISTNQTTTHYIGKLSIGDLVVMTGDTEEIREEFFGSFPLNMFFENDLEIYIPNKIERWLEWYAPKKQLANIHTDFNTAVELCLMFLSNLSNSYYLGRSDNWKRLNLEILSEQLCLNENDNTHKKIIDFLIKNKIIERSETWVPKKQSYSYRLTEAYLSKGLRKYKLTANRTINLYRKNYFKRLNDAIDNPIANNMIKMYQTIELPSQEEIIVEAKKLIKNKYKTKKGKILTFLNKHSKDYFADSDSRSFVEDGIELYNRLTADGTKFLIPMTGDAKSGGRVTDSLTLMPSWIRNLVKINGDKNVEADFQCLHPNIAMEVYGGNSEYITHKKVAEDSGIELSEVKKEHLSFFNKTWSQMTSSPLFSYYSAREPKMMENIFRDKDMFGHKITSSKMFKIEVKIMTEAIKKLNSEGIYVGYIYDALFCTPKQLHRVIEIMDEMAIKNGIKTKAK